MAWLPPSGSFKITDIWVCPKTKEHKARTVSASWRRAFSTWTSTWKPKLWQQDDHELCATHDDPPLKWNGNTVVYISLPKPTHTHTHTHTERAMLNRKKVLGWDKRRTKRNLSNEKGRSDRKKGDAPPFLVSDVKGFEGNFGAGFRQQAAVTMEVNNRVEKRVFCLFISWFGVFFLIAHPTKPKKKRTKQKQNNNNNKRCKTTETPTLSICHLHLVAACCGCTKLKKVDLQPTDQAAANTIIIWSQGCPKKQIGLGAW